MGTIVRPFSGFGNEGFSSGFRVSEHSFTAGASFFIQDGVVAAIKPHIETTPNWQEIIYGDPYFLQAADRYLLHNLLSKYGEPGQILVYVLEVSDAVYPDYFLLVTYPKLGVLAEYSGQSKERGDRLQLCPNKAMISMWLWLPEKLSLADAYSYEPNIGKTDKKNFLERFLPLETAARMDNRSFFEQFKSPQACLETPASLWGR